MTTFLLVSGAGGDSWFWHPVVAALEQSGHRGIAVDLPGPDESAGLAAYADLVVEAGRGAGPVVLVAQSMGGFTAALVCARRPQAIERLVFVNAMIPLPGETAGSWWGHVGAVEAREAAARRGGYPVAFDLDTYFLHDVPPEVAAAGAAHQCSEAKIAFGEPATFQAWPAVPIQVVVGRDDRFIAAAFQERVARERLGKPVEVLPGGHMIALSHPRELAEHLLA